MLIGLASEKLEQGTTIQANVYLNNEQKDRTIDCTLENNVDPENGKVQGNFLCSADKSTKFFGIVLIFLELQYHFHQIMII